MYVYIVHSDVLALTDKNESCPLQKSMISIWATAEARSKDGRRTTKDRRGVGTKKPLFNLLMR